MSDLPSEQPVATEAAEDARVTSAVREIVSTLEEAVAKDRPLELDPARGRLFEVFERAYGAGLTGEDGPLGPDELTRLVGHRWGLDESAKAATADQKKLDPADVSKMRVLWSLLRMWMEWDYAWNRFPTQTPNQPR